MSKDNHDIGLGAAALWFVILAMVILFTGEPDIHDLLIEWFQKTIAVMP